MANPAAILTPCRFGACVYPNFAAPAHVLTFQRMALHMLFDPTFNRVVVQCPVRHGKSAFWSVIFPAWYLIAHPENRVAIVAASGDLAQTFAAQVRDLIRVAEPLSGITIDPNKAGTASFKLKDHRGGLDAMGSGGQISGRGYNWISGDDLVQSEEAARSPVQRENLTRWWFSDLLSRGEPNAKIALVMSRRHPSDLSGQALALNVELPTLLRWHEVTFKAIQDDNTALWPERYPLSVLKDKRKEYEIAGQSYLFEALYQQSPIADPSSIEWPSSYFDNIFYSDDQPIQVRTTFGAVDMAQGRSESGDYSCAVRVAEDIDGNLWVTDSLMVRCPVPEFEERAAQFFATNQCDAVLFEGNVESGALAHIVELAQTRYGVTLYSNSVFHTEPKDVRLRKRISPPLHQHTLRFRNTPSNKLIVQQMREFPSAAHDDGPDAIATAIELKQAYNGEPV